MEKCKRKKRRKETFEIGFIWVVLLFLMGSGAYLFSKLEPIPLVIFAGGGSVKNYIGHTEGVWIDSIESVKIPKSVYINVPSEYGWTLLKEEIDRFRGDSKPHPFLYICLSADSITRDFINKVGLKEKGKKDSCNACIYGCHIGDDSLMVYVANTANDRYICADHISDDSLLVYVADAADDNTIFVDSLRKIIEPFQSNYNKKQADTVPQKLFATSRKSGTLRRYENVLGVSFDTISNTLFYETDVLKNSDVAVVLGSSFYRPKIKNSNNKWLYVVDANGYHIKKPMFLYFVVFNKDGFKPNKQIIYFFEKSLNNSIPIPEPIQNGNGIGNDLNSYPEWCEFNISN